jgi:hypothetical protein
MHTSGCCRAGAVLSLTVQSGATQCACVRACVCALSALHGQTPATTRLCVLRCCRLRQRRLRRPGRRPRPAPRSDSAARPAKLLVHSSIWGQRATNVAAACRPQHPWLPSCRRTGPAQDCCHFVWVAGWQQAQGGSCRQGWWQKEAEEGC